MDIKLKSNRPMCQMVRISPVMAEAWREMIPERQRPINELRVQLLSRAIIEGRWVDCAGNAIVFDRSGNLVDGQHRLLAVVRAKKSITSFVITGVVENAIFVLDHEIAVRTLGHSLKLHGEGNYNVLAGAIKWLWRYENGIVSGPNISPDTQQAFDLLKANPGIRNSVSVGAKCSSIYSVTLGTFCHFLFARVDAQKSDRFFECLTNGVGLRSTDETSGIWLFRERLLKVKTQRGMTMNQIHKIALCFKAWNFFASGVVVKNLKWISSEAFPQIA